MCRSAVFQSPIIGLCFASIARQCICAGVSIPSIRLFTCLSTRTRLCIRRTFGRLCRTRTSTPRTPITIRITGTFLAVLGIAGTSLGLSLTRSTGTAISGRQGTSTPSTKDPFSRVKITDTTSGLRSFTVTATERTGYMFNAFVTRTHSNTAKAPASGLPSAGIRIASDRSGLRSAILTTARPRRYRLSAVITRTDQGSTTNAPRAVFPFT